MRDVHVTFTVRPPAYMEADPARVATRLDRVVKNLLARVGAYFECDSNGAPLRAPDGTYLVHAPDWTAIDFLRIGLGRQEGMVIVSEQEAPGRGWRSA